MPETFEDQISHTIAQVNAVQRLPTMSLSEIDDMVARKHDLEFQVGLCKSMMAKDQFLPFPFERAAILLRKAGNREAERIICEYTERWAARSKAEYAGGAMIWRSPTVQKLIARLAKMRASKP
jgi:hypothetical protein